MIDAAFTNHLPITQCENHAIKYREHADHPTDYRTP